VLIKKMVYLKKWLKNGLSIYLSRLNGNERVSGFCNSTLRNKPSSSLGRHPNSPASPPKSENNSHIAAWSGAKGALHEELAEDAMIERDTGWKAHTIQYPSRKPGVQDLAVGTRRS
jgi:hypothetical protein